MTLIYTPVISTKNGLKTCPQLNKGRKLWSRVFSLCLISCSSLSFLHRAVCCVGTPCCCVELQEVVLAIGGGWWPAQAPLGSSLARPDSKSTSLKSRSTSARFFSRAPRWDWSKRPDMLDCSRRNWGRRTGASDIRRKERGVILNPK